MAAKILWIDDIPDQVVALAEGLRDEGFLVEVTSSATEGAARLAETPAEYLAVIVDLLMDTESFTVPGPHGPELIDTRHGLHSGLVFGRWAKRRWPALNIIGVSVKANLHDEQVLWFREIAEGYFDKYRLYTSLRPLLLLLRRLEAQKAPSTVLKTYIVPGRDTATLEKLRRYLKTALRIPAFTMIRDDPGSFEELLKDETAAPGVFKLVFVILTVQAGEEAEAVAGGRQSRDSLLFQAGFCTGQCLGGGGKVILLHTGEIPRLPADLPGLSVIDISAGLEEAGDRISREVSSYLPMLRRAG